MFTTGEPWNASSGAVPRASVAYVSLSGVVLGLGLVSNLVVAALMCSQRSLVNRLLVSLCLSDLLVCIASAPLAVSSQYFQVDSDVCRIAAFAQEIPVAASTLGLSMLALERYAAIRPICPLSQLRRLAVGIVWLLAALAAAPMVVVKCDADETDADADADAAAEALFSPPLKTGLHLAHLTMVFVLPCATLAVCHLTVSYKLCDVSLSAAAARGEVPLPLPLLRHPQHVIIVASVAHDGPSKMVPYGDGDSSDDEAKIRADLRNQRASSKYSPHHRRKNKVQHVEVRAQPACFRRPQSLRSRRQLAVLLVAQVVIFAICWLPYVVYTLFVELSLVSGAFLHYSLLLGHAHSVINPIVYWFLNRHTLPWPRSRLLRKLGTFRLQKAPPPNAPSSTNEAALGPFHPRYATMRALKAKPSTRVSRRSGMRH